MKKMIKDTLVLLTITVISGVSLGFVYHITEKPRNAQETKIKNDAYREVFPDADSFGSPLKLDKDKIDAYIAAADEKNRAEDEENENDPIDAEINEAVEAYGKDGEISGYVITVTDMEAYDGRIKFSVGIREDGTVNGISFLSISETPGLGMRADDDAFKKQFEEKNVPYFRYTKTGDTDAEAVDALSGATVTSNAVTNGATAAVYCFDYLTGGDADE